MGLSSEQVHWFGGACFTLVALLQLVHGLVPDRIAWAPRLVPLLFIGYGLESALDPLIHGRALSHGSAEMAQHLAQGGAMFLAGLVEWRRLTPDRLSAVGWGLVTPAALLVVGVVFLVHAQHTASVSPEVLMIQHRAYAVTLLVAAAARAVFVLTPSAAAFRIAWLLPLLTFGLLLLSYTEQVPGARTAPAGAPSTHDVRH